MGGWWDSVDAVARFNNWMQVSIAVFGFLTAAATALTIVASNRIGSLQSAESAQMRKQLEVTSDRLAAADQAIEATRGEAAEARAEAAEVANRDIFRPLAQSLRSRVQSDLSSAHARFQDHLARIKVACEAGNSSRHQVCQELAELLRSAGFGVDGPTQITSMASFALPPLRVSLHPADSALAEAITGALASFISTGFADARSENWTSGLIEIHVYGLPAFRPDGSLELR
jgi:hypothetical protein